MTDLVPDGYWDRLETMLTACTKVEEPDHDIDIDFFNQGAIMNDQELLEFAAKAAGYIEEFCPDGWTDNGPWRWHEEMRWNPLADDGDALRLAVKLNLGISIPVHKTIRADVVCFCDSSINVREEGGDPYAATRRAIVRTAAQIGKDMK